MRAVSRFLSKRLANRSVLEGKSSPRRGAVTVLAIVVLLILTGLLGQQLRRVLMDRRQLRQDFLHVQAVQLAEAGLLMAEESRKQDPAWSGTTWNLGPGTIHKTNSADVVIEVHDDVCTAVARYPANATLPFKATRSRKLSP